MVCRQMYARKDGQGPSPMWARHMNLGQLRAGRIDRNTGQEEYLDLKDAPRGRLSYINKEVLSLCALRLMP